MIPFLGCYHYPTFSCLPFWVPPQQQVSLTTKSCYAPPKDC